jgi:hypothetical protein
MRQAASESRLFYVKRTRQNMQSLELKGPVPTMPELPSVTLNSLKLSMGHADLHPSMLAPSAIDKLSFMHQLVHSPAGDQP